MDQPPVRNLTAVAYALPAFVLALMGVTFYVLLPKFYTDVVGVNASTLGIIILVSRIWDALLDPTLGFLSDRTQSRFGRRRPWMALATLPLVVTFIALLSPRELPDVTSWVGVSTFLFFIFWTAVSVPYQSLGPELSFSYDERTKVFAIRDGALVVGTLCSVLFPELLKHAGVTDQRALFGILGFFYGFLLIAAIGICFFVVQEKTWREDQKPRGSIFENVRSVLKNKPFLILLLAYVIGGFGSQLPATLFLYYVQYVLKSESGPFFLLLYFTIGFLFLPFWVWLSKRIGKKECWIAAMIVNAGAFVGVLFLSAGDVAWYTVIVIGSGLGYGAVLALPSSMQADVIDYDESLTGKRREGQITGFWLVANKLAAALGAGIALPLLEGAGYKPNVEQSPEVVSMLKMLYGGAPCLCYGIAIAVACFYPLSKERYEKMRAELESKKESGA